MNDEYDKTKKSLVENGAINEPDVESEQSVSADNFDITLMNAGALPTPAIAEDRSMNAPNTNPLAEKISTNWEMPPVFRVSSGRKLSKANQKTPPSFDSPPIPAQTSAPDLPNAEIQPQPFIVEQSLVGEAIVETSAKTNNKTLKLILLIIGLVIVFVLAAAILLGV